MKITINQQVPQLLFHTYSVWGTIENTSWVGEIREYDNKISIEYIHLPTEIDSEENRKAVEEILFRYIQETSFTPIFSEHK
jgi:hypothetical protein